LKELFLSWKCGILTKVFTLFPTRNSVVHAISVLSNQLTTHTQRCHIPCSQPPHLCARIALSCLASLPTTAGPTPLRVRDEFLTRVQEARSEDVKWRLSEANSSRAVPADEEKAYHLFPQIIHKFMSQVPLTRDDNNSRSYDYS